MKTLIVYYSLEGNSEYVAKKIEEKLSCDMVFGTIYEVLGKNVGDNAKS